MRNRVVSAVLVCLFFAVLSFHVAADNVHTVSPMVAAGYDHSLGLNKYGRVYAAGGNDKGQCNTFSWSNVKQIAAGKFFSAALFFDGTVAVTGSGDGTHFDVSQWNNIVQIAAGEYFLVGLCNDGTVVVTGNSEGIDVSALSDIEKIAAGRSHIIALKKNKTCINCGNSKTATVGAWRDIVDVFAGIDMSIGLKSDSTLVYAGEAMTYPGTPTEDEPQPPSYWKGMLWTDIERVSIGTSAAGRGTVIALKKDGTLITDMNEGEMNAAAVSAYNISGISSALDVSVSSDNINTHSLVLGRDGSVATLGSVFEGVGQTSSWKKDISYWNLYKQTLSFEEKTPVIVPGAKSVFIKTISGDIMKFGNGTTDISKFYGTRGLSASLSSDSDMLAAIDAEGKAVTSLGSDEEDYGISKWQGLEKLSLCYWQNGQIAVGLRWDGLVYTTAPKEYSLMSIEPMSLDGSVIRTENARDIASGRGFFAVLNADKTVSVYIDNRNSYRMDVSQWSNVEKIYAGFKHLVGVRTDGTCVYAGKKTINFAGEITDDTDVTACDAAAEWTDIKEIAAGDGFTVGLKNDGTCVLDRKTGTHAGMDVSSWSNISKVYAGGTYCIGYTNDGEILLTGVYNDEIAKLTGCTLTENGLFRLTGTKDGNSIYISFERKDGKPMRGKILIAFYDENDMLAYVKVGSFIDDVYSQPLNIESVSAASWKFYVWDNDMRPVYKREGTVR